MGHKTNVKFDTKQLESKIMDTFNKVKRNKSMLNEIGVAVTKRIASEGKRGTPFNSTRSFPSLKPSTIKNRERLKKFNKVARVFSKARSNLSLTGQLWDSLTHFIKQNFVEVKFTKRRTPYRVSKDKFAKQSKYNKTNFDLAKTLRDIGFEAFDSEVVAKDEKIIKRINSIVKRTLRRALRVANLNK